MPCFSQASYSSSGDGALQGHDVEFSHFQQSFHGALSVVTVGIGQAIRVAGSAQLARTAPRGPRSIRTALLCFRPPTLLKVGPLLAEPHKQFEKRRPRSKGTPDHRSGR